ncbi:MAG: site-specific DNA-methyltransferase [Muribaculaceae bacterium]|nr:site-specific DNA-methyltransferase [Muribaculaceae bacterium]
MNKTELARKIQALDGLDNEEKTALLELLRKQKKYGLVWEEKSEDIEERLRDELPILVERNDEKVHPIISDNPDAPNHLIIEGDNLAALTELSYTHAGKIDVIYIDPPYNTGKKDEFKYNDDFIDSEDDFRHSKWLCFMKRRLKLAHSLLSDNGIIFISIDDNEIAQLKCLVDEIFNSSPNIKLSNSLGVLVWDLGTGTQAGHFTRSHEYVLAYCKNKSLLPNFSGGEGIIDHSALKKISKKNPPVEYTFKAGTIFLAPNGTELFDSWGESEKTELVAGQMVAENGKLKYDVTLRAGFAMISQMKSWFNGQYTIDSKGQEVVSFYFNASGVLHYKKNRSIINPSSTIKDVGSTKSGTTELFNIIGSADSFVYPKPSALIKFLLSLKATPVFILDFFAGSGTTLHAVMQLNAEDGGKRTCILCTNNENGICENVTYERNKRVIEGYTKPNGEYVAGLTDNNLRYYRTEFLPRERSVKNMRELVKASTGLLCIKNDLYTEAPFGGKKMNSKYARYFEHGEKRMLVIYDERTIPFIVDIVKSLPEGEKIKVYVFSYGSYSYEDEFAEVENQVELCALPQAIYDAYQKVLPKRKPKFIVDDLVYEIEEYESTEVQGTLDFDFEETEKGGDE